MSDYLLEISIGPVQEFIASARRMRDLWFGSMMLSELAKAAALSVMENGGTLIFPSVTDKKELAPNSPLSVANVILAEFTGEHDFREIARLAREAAVKRLKVFAEGTFRRMQGWIDWTRWNSQINDIIEFYSAWTPIVNGNYYEARHNVARLLAARKNIRNFAPTPCPAPVPKSSLDGLRESVFRHRLNEADIANIEAVTGDIRIKRGESLDAIGLIKRVPGKDDERFMPVSDAAIDSGQDGEHYVAFICADGDRMGAALGRMTTADEHRKFSRDLSGFAGKAREVVSDFGGQCIYTGGDDVMAFIALNKAMPCVRELHELFGRIMGGYGASLSVGLSVAHAKEDLSQLLQWGRDAETAAKKGADGKADERGEDRDGLAVSIKSRGSEGFTVREQWKPQAGDGAELSAMSLDERLMWFADRFTREQIPAKFPYELRENAAFYDNWEAGDALKTAVTSDVMRIFRRKDISLSDEDKKLVNSYIAFKVHDAESMRLFADELIAAEWLCQ
ncbi:MAG: type III-B CRISPR-associated protein Cas10/Cmr2 [Synergistaceae bacterium]|nr:type III-B CRISPR-associated protein Cas10/Cmr2 [Synergistaceae bacterium]